jgi:cell division cycle 20-like protein 1, cofactor of APC complex
MAVAAPASDAKPRLNVPPSMAAALRLDPVGLGAGPSMPSPSRRLAEPPKTPSPSKTTYSDRFIPCRSSSRLQNFALIDSPLSPAKDDTPYSRLLRAELFGPDSPKPTTATSAASASPNTNLFRFKKDHSAPTSPFAKAAAAHHDCTGGSGDAPSPQKPPRKVPKTPHKVGIAPSFLPFLPSYLTIPQTLRGQFCWSTLPRPYYARQVLDAPSLQDDFYLNLVDWSSQNVLAVGLGTCVYLWSASNSKVLSQLYELHTCVYLW